MNQPTNFRKFRPQNLWEFYRMLNAVVGRNFKEEVMATFEWAKTTFYERIHETKTMKLHERKRLMRIVHKYAKENYIRLNF